MSEQNNFSNEESELELNRKLYNEELKEACRKIANLKKPISDIARIVRPLGIRYITVFNVFIGKSNRQEILDTLTQLGIPHNRKQIRDRSKRQVTDE